MLGDKIFFSINNILDFIKPQYVVIFFFLVLFIVIIFISIILFHFKTYREYNPFTIKARSVFLFGLILLFILAIYFLIMFVYNL